MLDAERISEREILQLVERQRNLDEKPIVLVVEDSPLNQKIAESVLRRLQVEVVIAGNGREALKAMARHKVSAILMDCQMPVLDGLETSRLIRADEQGKGTHVPIIAVTAHASREECLDAGMDDHICKPLTTASAAMKLNFWLQAETSALGS